MRMEFRGLALGAGVVMSAFTGCASAPQLRDDALDHLGKTEVVYVTPGDDIVVTDPIGTHIAHIGKLATLDYLFGVVGVIAYAAGVRSEGSMDDRMQRSRQLFQDQKWPERMNAAALAAGSASRLRGATWITMDHDPGVPGMEKLAADGGFDSVVTVVPEMQMATDGDELRMTVAVEVLTVKPPKPCRVCDYGQTAVPVDQVQGNQQLMVLQDLKAVDGGKTWDEQKLAGHKLHDLTSADFAYFWFNGDPAPLKTFMDTGFQSLQSQLTIYFGGKASVPPPLPTLKLVVNP